jgi:diamine N-acetyltransferase
MDLTLRPTEEDDLPFVVESERRDAGSRFVTSEGFGRHMEYLADPDVSHLIIERDGDPAGYLILAGLMDENENIEFRRIVVTQKGCGIGRMVLQMIKDRAFGELNAHRLWLDVKTFNERARHLYESEGFTVEGTIRECVKTENGRESVVLMSILRSEFERAEEAR